MTSPLPPTTPTLKDTGPGFATPVAPTSPSPMSERDRKKSQQEASGCQVPFVPVTTSNLSRFKQLSTRRSSPRNRTISSPNLQQPVVGSAMSAGVFFPVSMPVTSATPGVVPHEPLIPTCSAPPTAPPVLPVLPASPVEHPNGTIDERKPLETLPGIGFTLQQPPSMAVAPSFSGPSTSLPGGTNEGSKTNLIGPPTPSGHWTVMDETQDHPGRRKRSGFFQPIKHLSGKL